MECNFLSSTDRWQMSRSTNISTHFCFSNYRFRDITILIYWLPKSRTMSRRVFRKQTIRWQTSISANAFYASSYGFGDITILHFWSPKNWSRSRSVIFAITLLDGKLQNLQTSPTHFCANSYRFQRHNNFKSLTPRSRSRSRCAIFTIIPFDGKCPILPTSFFYFWFSLRCALYELHTHRHTNTEMDKSMTICEILQIFLKTKIRRKCELNLHEIWQLYWK